MKKIFTLAAAVLASFSLWADVDLKQGASYDFTTITADAFAGLETSNAYWSSNTTGYYQNNKYQPTEATAFLLTSTGTEIAGFEGLKCITGSSSGRVRIYTNGNGLYFNSNNAKLVFPAVEKDQIIIVRYANVSSDEAKFALTNATQSQDVTNHVDTVKVSADGDVTLTYNSKKFYIKTIDVIANVKSPILKSIRIAGIDCEIVKAADAANPDTIKGELPYGTVVADAVAAITTDDFVLGGTATSLRVPYPYTSVYARDDDGNEKEYFIACTVNATVSTDATLKSLSLNNIAVVLEEDVYEYNLELPYATLVSAAYEVNDVAASAEVTSSTDAQIVVTVTAQAGNHQAYTVNYVILPAKKDLLEAAFSNGAKGAITDGKIRVPYLASEEEPTFTSARFWNADGEPTAVVEGTNLKVTGIDGVDSLYALEFVALTPAAVAYDTEITFDSTETYIFSTYGFGKYIKDSDYRGWKFAKAVEEATNKRISDGRARLYFAIPAADSLILVSGTGGERGIKVYVNGVENTTVTKTAKNNESIVLKDLRPDAANFIAIESNQTGGDGGFIKMQLGKPTTTALDNTDAAVKAEKVIREGQVLIIRDGKTFNVLGARVR